MIVNNIIYPLIKNVRIFQSISYHQTISPKIKFFTKKTDYLENLISKSILLLHQTTERFFIYIKFLAKKFLSHSLFLTIFTRFNSL